MSNQTKKKSFYYYVENSGLSTLYRRLIAEPIYGIKAPKKIYVDTSTVDIYCEKFNINKINFLKIDTEGAELDVLKGSENMLKNNKIDHIQFEYGGCFLDSNTTLQQLCKHMSIYNYQLYKIEKDNITIINEFDNSLENFIYSNFLYINKEINNYAK
jgi:hypothetical protein